MSSCAREFGNKSNLLRHVKSVHMKTEFICGLCKKSFSLKDNLNYHTKTVHKDIRQFQCQKCNKKFKQKQHLDKHKTLCGLCKDCNTQFQSVQVVENHTCKGPVETSSKVHETEVCSTSDMPRKY